MARSFPSALYLDGLELGDVVAAVVPEDLPGGDPVGAQAVQDGLCEAAHGREAGVDVERVAVAAQPVEGGLEDEEWKRVGGLEVEEVLWRRAGEAKVP